MGTLSHTTARKARSAALLFLVPLLAGCATVAMGSPVAAPTAAPTAPAASTAAPAATATTATSSESAFYWYILDANGKPSRGLACLNTPSGNVWVCEQSSGEKVYFSPAVPLMISSEPVN